MSWEDLKTLLSNFKVTGETFEEYQAMESLEKLAIKDQGWFVGGVFDPPQRKTFNLKVRTVVSLDLDHMSFLDVAEIKETYGKYTYLVHSSHSHSEDSPRLRLILPLARDVSPEEYEPLARMIANQLDMNMFDDTTYQFSRIMFLPSHSLDADPYLEINEGEWIDPDFFLGLYEDVEDFGSWPRSSRQDLVRPSAAKAQDPFTKPGIIGAFNRAYSIPEAIITFELPYEESGQGDGRYTYTAGTSADGAVYYPDDGHLFSHHESDPAHGNQNAWDLVRLHRFGDDTETDINTPMLKRPTMQQMVLLAGADKMVQAELAGEMFEDCSAESEEPESGEAPAGETAESAPAKAKSIDFKSIHNAIQAAYDNTERDVMDLSGDIINMLAAAKLIEHQEERLVNELIDYNKTKGEKITKTGMMKSIKSARKAISGQTAGENGDTIDIEEEILKRLLDEHFEGGKTIRCIDGVFWLFEAGRWGPEDPNRILHKLDTLIIDLRTNRPKAYRSLVAGVADRMTSAISGSLKSMFAHMVSALHDAEDPLKLRRRFGHPVMNLRNCELHFNQVTGSMRVLDHTPESFLDVRLNVEYDAEAACPEWDRFCGLIFADSMDPEDMQRHLEEVMGYTLNFHKWMKKFGIFVGYTDAGKSTIVDVLKSFLDGAYVEAPITMFSEENRNQFTNGLLLHKLLLVDEERSKTGLLPDSALKSLAEEKAISTDIKYGGMINFVSRVYPLIVSNHWPRSGDISDAFLRRAMVWNFKHEIPEEERSDIRRDEMMRELPGILNKLSAGLSRLRARGHFAIPMDCEEAKEEWITHSNQVAKFVKVALVTAGSREKAPYRVCVKVGEVFSHYQEWASMVENTPLKYQVKREEFWERMGFLGHKRSPGKVDGKCKARRVLGLVNLESDDFD